MLIYYHATNNFTITLTNITLCCILVTIVTILGLKHIKNRIPIRKLCVVGLFAAITAVTAQIIIPTPFGVPMTLQTFAIALAGILLGSKRGGLAILVYILLGAGGAPVFAHFTGGFVRLVGVSGGFILSFPLMAWIIGLGAERGGKLGLCIGLIVGTTINYICGVAVFMLATHSSFPAAWGVCIMPFIPIDAVKMTAAGFLGMRLKRRLTAA